MTEYKKECKPRCSGLFTNEERFSADQLFLILNSIFLFLWSRHFILNKIAQGDVNIFSHLTFLAFLRKTEAMKLGMIIKVCK